MKYQHFIQFNSKIILILIVTLLISANAYTKNYQQINSVDKEILILGDIEGFFDQIQTMIDEGDLILNENKLNFKHPDAYLVFTGDLSDRSHYTTQIMEMLLDLKSRYPNRVKLVLGNREINKLTVIQKLPKVKNLTDLDYVKWLTKQIDVSGKSKKNIQKLNESLPGASSGVSTARSKFWKLKHR